MILNTRFYVVITVQTMQCLPNNKPWVIKDIEATRNLKKMAEATSQTGCFTGLTRRWQTTSGQAPTPPPAYLSSPSLLLFRVIIEPAASTSGTWSKIERSWANCSQARQQTGTASPQGG